MRNIFLFSLATTGLMLADDFLQKLFTSNNDAELELNCVLVIWLLNLLLWWSGVRWLALLITALFAMMQLPHLMHIAITGNPLNPYDISKALAESEEIGIALAHELELYWHVLIAWGLPYGLLFFLFFRYGKTLVPAPSWVPVVLVCLLLGYKPERATRRDMLAFMPGPTRSTLHNSINAFSYYAVRMAGRDGVFAHVALAPYELVRDESLPRSPDNIVVFMTESLRAERMSVFGYPRQTTPFLQSLKDRGELQLRQGLAASVATGSSLPLFFNVVNEPGNIRELQGGSANLFRLAQEAGYKTFWLSAQESKTLSGLGNRYIDVEMTREDDQLAINRMGDSAISGWLERQPWSSKNFIVVNYRSVHSPYSDNYEHVPEVARWPDAGKALTSATRRNNAYDNAVVFLDNVLHQHLTAFEAQLPGRSVAIITSDHGQMLGEGGHWGHNRLVSEVAAVPVAVYQWSTHATPPSHRLPDQPHMSHYELGGWILELMQYQLINPNHRPGVRFLQGEDLYGDNLYRPVLETDGQLVYCDVTQVRLFSLEPDC